MPIVRFSGRLQGKDDPQREVRSKLLYQLFRIGWDIYNANGDQRITLRNIEKKIIESDAFVFTPGATLEDMFKATSVLVGYQTKDPHLDGKPTLVLDSDGSWGTYYSLMDHLHETGMIRQKYRELLIPVPTVQEIIDRLTADPAIGTNRNTTLPQDAVAPSEGSSDSIDGMPEINVCVFCSASIRTPTVIEDGYQLGKALAQAGLGCVSGAGNSGVMGSVVRGAVENNGWAGGSNVPHIIELEGLPEGINCFWPRPDIYLRMEVMIQRSQAFVIFPGGAGTLQELLALLILHQQQSNIMERKPVIIFNRLMEDGTRFWGPLLPLLEAAGGKGFYTEVTKLEDIVPTVKKLITQ